MTDLNCVWREDLNKVKRGNRLLARVALNLHLASLAEKARLTPNPVSSGMKRLIRPLLKPEAVKTLDARARRDGDKSDKEGMTTQSDWDDVLSVVPASVLAALQEVDFDAQYFQVVALIGDTLSLNPVEKRILLFIELLNLSGALRYMCRETSRAPSHTNANRLAHSLELEPREVRIALAPNGRLQQLALVEVASQSDLEDFVTAGEVLNKSRANEVMTEKDLLSVFLEPLSPSQVSLSCFPHLRAETDLLNGIFQGAIKDHVKGVNVLFYGGAGTGKTELAKAFVEKLGAEVFSVRSTDLNGDPLSREGRIGGYLMAQVLLQDRTNQILIFDEIEDLQTINELMVSRSTGYAPSKDKGWLTRVLETNQVPTIWITNDIQSLDPAVRRRFLLPVEFKTPPKNVRREIANRILGEAGVSTALINEIADDIAITPAAIDNARRVVKLCAAENPDQTVRQVMAKTRQAIAGRASPRARAVNTTIDLRLLNIEGAKSPEAVIDGMRKSGQGRICAYGKPGTGKTQFAEILAQALNKELVVAPASSVLSCFVGETERNLAELFEQTDPAQAIILLDEVDSFLADRTEAQRSWERTMVNELLQQMERFNGVFIAATNLMEGLDPAALRRFDLKLMFGELTRTQRYQIFAQEALGSADQPVPETSQRLLDQLEGLTLGDVANVQRQQMVLGESLAPEQFLRQLRSEWELKSKAVNSL